MHRAGRLSQGFTILEVLIAIVVISILAVIVIVSYDGVQQRTHSTVLTGDLVKTGGALQKYKQDNGTFPTSLEAINVETQEGVELTYHYDAENDTYCLEGTNEEAALYNTSSKSEPIAGSCADE